MKSKNLLIICAFLAWEIFFLISGVYGFPIISANSGYWNYTGTWAGGTIPSSTDSVVISSGHTVLFDRNDASTTCGTIEVKSGGTLKFDSGTRTMQIKGDINVYGKLELVPGSTLKLECETNGQYGIIVYSGGELKGTGSVPTVLTTLAAPLNIGSDSITVANASGFGVGDIITLGSGANAEGFTISAISGNQITLNRKALNAQDVGAEAYKNATVTTSDVFWGTKTFTVSDIGGIQAGDCIVVATTSPSWGSSYWDETEIFIVESVSSNSITVKTPSLRRHSSGAGAIVLKTNRDTLITSVIQDANHNGYILIDAGAAVDINFIEMKYLGVMGGSGSTNVGFYVNSALDKTNIKACSFHNMECGIKYESGIALVSNVVYLNYDGIMGDGWISPKANSYLISNFVFKNGYGLEMFNSEKQYLLNNYLFSNSENFIWSANNIVLFNSVFSNHQYGLQIWPDYDDNVLILYGNSFRNNVNYGLFYGRSNWGSAINNEFSDSVRFGYGISNTVIANSYFCNGFSLLNRNDRNPTNIILRDCNLDLYSVSFSGFHPDTCIISQNSNHVKGITKIWGNDKITGSLKFNYTDLSYSSYASFPYLFKGSSHTISSIATNNNVTTSEVWFVTYRASTSNWEVKGTVSGLQSNRATSGVLYTSDNGQVKFTITQAAGVQDGDQFVFATIAAAGDANTQKKILFGPSAIAELNNQSRLVVEPGGKLELKGTAEYPTLIDYDGTGGYGIVISGEVDAQYFDFNQINSDGVKIDPTATITKFDNGNIRNVSDLGLHLSVNGKDHTFNYLNFDNTGAYDVKASNAANLIFVKSQRGKFLDAIADTSSISWDNPVLGFTSDNLLGTCTVDTSMGVVAIPFRIKDIGSSICTFETGSAYYSVNNRPWLNIPDANLSGTDGTFESATSFALAPVNHIYWLSKDQLGSTFETNVKFRFRVNNGYVYGDHGLSEGFIVDFAPPTVNVISPSGGENWAGGSSHAITWTASDVGSGIKDNSISLYYTTGEGYVLIASNEANDGTYSWTLPEIDSSTIKVKVTAGDNVNNIGSDESDSVFTIDSTPPTVDLTSPDGGEDWIGGSTHDITWTASDNLGLVDNQISIYYSSGEGYVLMAENEANGGVYPWIIPKIDSDTVKVKIIAFDKAGNGASAESSSTFTISVPPTVTLLSPNGGEKIAGNSTYDITWIATDEGGGLGVAPITIKYSTNGTDWILIASNEANDGSYSWNVPEINSSTVKISIEAVDLKGNKGNDSSNSNFMVDSLPPSVAVSSPNGGESICSEKNITITWNATDEGSGIAENSINLYYNTGEAWQLIASTLPNTGSYVWTPPMENYGNVRIKVTATDNVGLTAEDVSDNAFALYLQPPVVRVIYPNGGESINCEKNVTMTWSVTDEGSGIAANSIGLYYSTGEVWQLITSGLANTGSYSWSPPRGNYGNVRIKVTASDNVGLTSEDASDNSFALYLSPPIVQVLSPNGGELFKGGATAAIKWTATDEGSGIADNSIDIYYNDGTQEVVIAENKANTGFYNWTTPKIDSENLKIKVTAYDNVGEKGEDASDASFAIDSTPPAKPTVNPVKSPTVILTQTLSGAKPADAEYVLVNGSTSEVSYPSSTAWNCTVKLKKGENQFRISTRDRAGNESEDSMVVILVQDIVLSDSNGNKLTIPEGAISKEANFELKSISPPKYPLRGAVMASDTIDISSEVSTFNIPVLITLKLKGSFANPRPFYYDAGTGKWSAKGLEIVSVKSDLFTFKTLHLSTFAAFDVIDTQAPTVSNFKANNLTVTHNDSIPDCPEISVDISDDFGIDTGALALTIDGQSAQALQAPDIQAESSAAVRNGTFRYKEKEPLPLGEHTFVIVASDEVGNSSSLTKTLYVVGSSVSGLMVYPNPYRIGETLKFDGLSGDVYVYIYDVAGDLVWKGFTSGAASISWDGKNHAGNTVAPGVYFYVVKDTTGGKSTGKIAVLK